MQFEHRAGAPVKGKSWADKAILARADMGAGLVRPFHGGEQPFRGRFQGGDPASRRGWLAVFAAEMGLVLVIYHHRRGALPPEGQQGVGILGGQTPCLGGHALEIAGPPVTGRKSPRREQLDAPDGNRCFAAARAVSRLCLLTDIDSN